MLRKIAPLALAVVLAAACEKKAPLPPPPLVQVTPAAARDVDLTSDWVVTLDGYENANIQPEVTGYLIAQDYAEGQPVKKNQVLFRIDPRPFQAALDQAEGALAEAKSQVTQAEAQVDVQKAQLAVQVLNVNRDQPEYAVQAIPQSQLQNDQHAQTADEAAVKAAQATVAADQSAVQAAAAQVEQAQLNLGFTAVRSLLDGVAGIAQVQIGNLVTPQTVLTTVSQLDPIKAYFPITTQDYLRSISHAPGAVDLLAPQSHVPLTLILADGSRYPYAGRVLFADRAVDTMTGTIRFAGAFPNPHDQLRPGQTGRVQAVTQHVHQAVLVPQAAVSQLQSEYQIDVVGPDHKVQVRTIEVGPTVGMDWVVTRGVSVGEEVVVEGADRVRDGMTVRTQPAPPAPPAAGGDAGDGGEGQ